jgi:hypothetical protein
MNFICKLCYKLGRQQALRRWLQKGRSIDWRGCANETETEFLQDVLELLNIKMNETDIECYENGFRDKLQELEDEK